MQRRTFKILLWTCLLTWFGFSGLLTFIVDLQWFNSVGYPTLFRTRWSMQIGLWLFFFCCSFFYVFLHIRRVTQTTRFKWLYLEDHLDVQLSEETWRSIFRALQYILALLPALSFAGFAGEQWLSGLAFLDPVSFQQSDTVFGHDLGFYVFQLPMLKFLSNWMQFLVLITLIITLVAHFARDVVFGGGKEGFTRLARAHLLGQTTVLFICFALDWYLQRFQVLFTQEGLVWGAGYTDIHARIPAYWMMCMVSLGLAVFAWRARTTKSTTTSTVLVLGYFALRTICVWLWPDLIQRLIVAPNELKYETPYVQENIRSSQWAYALDRIQVKAFEVRESLDRTAIEANPLTINNIRIWDDRPLLTTYGQLQEIRSYYDFYDVDIDRYVINGELRQVMLAGRELNYSNVSGQAQSWLNAHFQYTHGYGLTMSPVNQVSQEGLPSLFIKDIPPQSTIDMTIQQPEIYFGELSNQYIVVGGDVEEFDYPKGDENVYTKFTGDKGINIGSFLQKALYAWYFGDIELLLSNYILPDSKLLFRRNVRERVQTLVPFLTMDSDPYMVVTEGRLVWMIDAYTTTDHIPYAESYPSKRFNYIRNSVKIIVDAYLGDVQFYVSDPKDPLIQLYMESFDGVFQSMEAFPSDLKSHIRYPEDYFNVQAWMYRSYHMNDVNVFYNKEDLWGLPTEVYSGKEMRMESYYLIMKLPGEDAAEFVLLLPFVPTGKDNMISWLAARSDGDEYGNLMLYQFPKQKLIYGPRQIEARIDQDPEISKQITLWSQSGSAVVRGNLLVIPIGDSLMYVEPLYLQAESSQLPELKRVIVAYENQIVMEKDLSTALSELFQFSTRQESSKGFLSLSSEQQAVINTEVGEPILRGIYEQVQEANQLFQAAVTAQRNGDWTGYGEHLQKLGMLLEEMKNAEGSIEEIQPNTDVEEEQRPILEVP